MSRLRATLDERQALRAVAQLFSMNERTLRRRLAELNMSYRQLLDEVRYERARYLLGVAQMPMGRSPRCLALPTPEASGVHSSAVAYLAK